MTKSTATASSDSAWAGFGNNRRAHLVYLKYLQASCQETKQDHWKLCWHIMNIYICIYIYTYVNLSIHPFTYTCESIYPSIHLPTYLPAYLSIYLSLHTYVYVCVGFFTNVCKSHVMLQTCKVWCTHVICIVHTGGIPLITHTCTLCSVPVNK